MKSKFHVPNSLGEIPKASCNGVCQFSTLVAEIRIPFDTYLYESTTFST